MKKLMTVGAAALLASGLAYAQGASVQQEVTTAHAHAMMAATADTIEIGHAHLHHVINCLVGPGGHGFDANVLDPCKGMGNGAIPDAKGNAGLQAALKQALASARKGVSASSLDAIHSDGNAAAAALASGGKAAPASSPGS